ncbi:MAG: hypothetical protein U0270_27250 [Labilithrix sp.]
MPENVLPPKGLFSTELDDIAQKLLKTDAPLPNERELQRELVRRGLAAAEALVLAPRVTFKVYGENVVLAVLARAIGAKGIREMLEEGGLEFMLWQSFPGHWSTSSARPAPKGIHPLAPITLTSAPHKDPLASAELGLRGWAPWMPESDAKPIARLAAERTSLVDPKLAPLACSKAHAAYAAGLLASRGLDGSVAFDDMTESQRSELTAVADDLHRMAAALGRDLEVHDDEPGWTALGAACSRLQDAERVIEVGQKIIRLERVPSISQLLLSGLVSHAEIPDIRRRKETLEFRKWLWSQPDPTDAVKVADAYLAALSRKADVTDSQWFKAMRIILMGVLGSVLGTAVAGPVGAGIGGAMASTGAGVATSLVDGFWIDALLGKANPRRLATDVLMPLATTRRHAAASLAEADAHAVEPARKASAPVSPSPAATLNLATAWANPMDERPTALTGAAAGTKTDVDALRRERNKRKARRKAQRSARRKSTG